jgi:hypothetical protein
VRRKIRGALLPEPTAVMVVDEEQSTFIHAAPPAQSPARLVPQDDGHWARLGRLQPSAGQHLLAKNVQPVLGRAIEIKRFATPDQSSFVEPIRKISFF